MSAPVPHAVGLVPAGTDNAGPAGHLISLMLLTKTVYMLAGSLASEAHGRLYLAIHVIAR